MSQTIPPTTHAPGTNGVPAADPPPLPLAEDGLPPFSEESLARFRERDWLDEQYNLGVLMQYYGEYVVSANRTILSHHRRMDYAIEAAEAKAKELDIPFGILTVYNVPFVDDIVE
jgi:hypothetical protein